MPRLATIRFAGFVTALLLLISRLSPAWAETRGPTEEHQRFLQGLSQARPIPMPEKGKTGTAVGGPGALLRFDLESRAITKISRSPLRAAEPRVEGNTGTPLPGIAPGGGDGIPGIGVAPGGGCTPPPLSLSTHGFPWRTVVKLLMRFNVGGTDYFYVCSAATVSDFHLLSAGHCVFNWDPNDDGDEDDAAWADEVWAWPAQTDLVDPFACEDGCPVEQDYPWGVSKAVGLISYEGWTMDEDLDHDMAYLVLDRRIGSRVGWMGAEAGFTTASLNFDGYPTETPYVPACTVGPYPGYDDNNVDGYTTYRIELCAYVYGGHSGGPEWRYDGVDRFIEGVNSTSDRMGSAEGTLLTLGKFSDLYDTIIPDDEANRPPVARPELIEYVLDLDAKDLLDNTVCQGNTFDVEYNLFNVGYVNSGAITVDFYLSSDKCIEGTDYPVGSVDPPSLDANTYYNLTTTLTVPCTVPPGFYYAGWIMGSTTPEYGTGDNAVVIADETISVTSTATPPDITVDATGGVVDENCEFLVPFEAVVTDACGLLAKDVDVAAEVVSGEATLGTPDVNVVQTNSTTVTVDGTVLVTEVTECPAVIEITVSAEDICGNDSEESATAEVVDETPPMISLGLDPDTLWPPNHKLVDITVQVAVEDACDAAATFVLTSITSDEPDDGTGDGDTENDIQGAEYGTADTEFQLRSERSGTGDGRTYTITYTAMDGCGNTADAVGEITVPHDQSGHAMASSGFLPDGTGIAPGASSFYLVIPGRKSLDRISADPRTIVTSRSLVGSTIGRIAATSSWLVDVDGDGALELALKYPAEATRDLAARAALNGETLALRYEDSRGTGYILHDIFALGSPLRLPKSGEPPDIAVQTLDLNPLTSAPKLTALVGTRPNPFSSSTTVWFDMASPGQATLEVYDLKGQRVRTLVDGDRPAGRHSAIWDGRDERGYRAAGGVYLFRFSTNDHVDVRKAVLTN